MSDCLIQIRRIVTGGKYICGVNKTSGAVKGEAGSRILLFYFVSSVLLLYYVYFLFCCGLLEVLGDEAGPIFCCFLFCLAIPVMLCRCYLQVRVN